MSKVNLFFNYMVSILVELLASIKNLFTNTNGSKYNTL